MKKITTVLERKEATKKWRNEYVAKAKQELLVDLWVIDLFEKVSKISAISPCYSNYIYYGHTNQIVLNHYQNDELMDHIDFEKLINTITKIDLRKLPKGISFVLTEWTVKSF